MGDKKRLTGRVSGALASLLNSAFESGPVAMLADDADSY
jgi:hypothetical protein